MSRCLNCDAEVADRYCPACGQSASTRRVTVRGLITSGLEHILDLEQPLIRTTLQTLLRPGAVAARYADGHRKPYTNPLKFLLLWGAVTVFLLSWAMNAIPAFEEIASPWASDEAEVNLPEWLTEDDLRSIGVLAHFLTLLALPLVAAAGRLVFLIDRRPFAEHLVLGSYVFGATFLMQLLTAPLLMLDHWTLVVTYQLLPLIYYTVGLVQFCERPKSLIGRIAMAIAAQIPAVIAMSVANAVFLVGLIAIRRFIGGG